VVLLIAPVQVRVLSIQVQVWIRYYKPDVFTVVSAAADKLQQSLIYLAIT